MAPMMQTLQGLSDHLWGAKGKGQTSVCAGLNSLYLSYLEHSERRATAPHQRELEWDKIRGRLTRTFFS